jgi:hypothetical protein
MYPNKDLNWNYQRKVLSEMFKKYWLVKMITKTQNLLEIFRAQIYKIYGNKELGIKIHIR